MTPVNEHTSVYYNKETLPAQKAIEASYKKISDTLLKLSAQSVEKARLIHENRPTFPKKQ